MKTKFEEAMDNLAGTMMSSPEISLSEVLGRDPKPSELADFEMFLEHNECRECEFCGWWTHPGEDCDCREYDEE